MNVEPQPRNDAESLREETRFGAYSVRLKDVSGLNESLRQALGLRDSDLYLEVHVPDSVEGAPRTVLGAFKQGAVELADFLIRNRLNPRCLIGITHQNVAVPARRFLNFSVVPGIPEEVVDRDKTGRIDRGYEMTRRAINGVPRGPLCFCYQSYDAFLRFTERLRQSEAY